MELMLDDETYVQLTRLSVEGNQLVDLSQYDQARKKFMTAVNLLPNPKNKWDAALWLYASIGDTYLFEEKFKEASENFYNALNCPDGQESAFVHLRLGQSFYELDYQKKAKEHLLKAYMLDGNEIFREEEKKYFDFLQKNVDGIV